MPLIKLIQLVVIIIGAMCVVAGARAENLKVQLTESLPKSIQENIMGHMGELPSNELERTAFVYSAKRHITNALRALGYYRANIQTNVSRQQPELWVLTINVQLNKPTLIDSIAVTLSGEAEHDPAFRAVVDNLPLKSGDVLHQGHYEQIKSDLTALGLTRGYFDAKLEEPRIAIHQSYDYADIIIHYDSGPRYRFGEVNFSPFEINEELLTTLIPFEPGEFYSTEKLRGLQQNLQQTRYFGNVLATLDTDAATDQVLPVEVKLDKAKRHSFDFGVGYATDTDFRLTAQWHTPLINRYGHRQETKIEYSQINPIGIITYSIPLTHPLDDILQLQLMLEDDIYGDLESKYWSTQVGRIQNRDGWIRKYYLRYLSEKWNADDFPEQQFEDNGDYTIGGFTWSRTVREGLLLDPTSGFSEYYNIEGAHQGVHSEISFIKFHARLKYITTLAKGHRFVARTELGYTHINRSNDASLAPSLRFFAGGDQSIRGFGYQSVGPTRTFNEGPHKGEKLVVGGTNIVVGSLEYQYYFSDTWRGAFFVDAGSVEDEQKFDPVYSIGPGIHYISPIGAVRLNFGYSLSKDSPSWRLHFNIGSEL